MKGLCRFIGAGRALFGALVAVILMCLVPASATAAEDGTEPGIWWDGGVSAGAYSAGVPRFSTVPPKTVAGEFGQYDAYFERDLFQLSDVALEGTHANRTLSFSTPNLWNVSDQSELHLIFEHSAALIAERSHLTVSINGAQRMSVRLDASNVTDGKVIIPLPIGSLGDYNRLKLEVHQHYTNDCEDPFDKALWTRISSASFIRFKYTGKAVNPDLLNYPLPLFDPLGYGATKLSYVLPTGPSPQTVDALGLVSASLGREVSYHPLLLSQPLRSVSESSGNIIVVGTPAENPEVGRLLGNKASGLASGHGLIALVPNPRNASAAILVVSGGDAAGVLKAAKTLASPKRRAVLSGQLSVVTQLVEEVGPEDRVFEDGLPPQKSFTLNDLGFEDTTVRGFYAPPITVPLTTLPDDNFVKDMQQIKVIYSYSAQLHSRMSSLEVMLGELALQSVPLDNPMGENRAELLVSVPSDVISPAAQLSFQFRLYPRTHDPCDFTTDAQIWGTIFDDSELDMPRYVHADMPDLGLLQFQSYPLGIQADLGNTMIVTADSPGPSDLLSAVVLSSELSRRGRSNYVAVQTRSGGSLTSGERSENHLILIASGNRNSELDGVEGKRPLMLMRDRKTLTEGGDLVLQSIDPNAHGVLEEIVSPYGKEKVILVVQGFTTEYLKSALSLLTVPSNLAQLSGDLALVGSEGSTKALKAANQVSFGRVPSSVLAQKWGRDNLWVMVFLLLMFLLFAFLVVQFLLVRHEGEQFDEEDDEDDDLKAWSHRRSPPEHEEFEEEVLAREPVEPAPQPVVSEAVAPRRRRRPPIPTRTDNGDEDGQDDES